jgi:hypothetical protein
MENLENKLNKSNSFCKKAIAGFFSIYLGIVSAGCDGGHKVGKNPSPNPEEYNSISEIADAPDMLPIEATDFWQTNPVYEVSPEAGTDLDAVMSYFTDNIPSEWGANDSGVVVIAELTAPDGIHTDTNNNGTADVCYRFTPANYAALRQSSLDDLDAKLNAPINTAETKELVAECFYHKWTPSALVYEDPAVYLIQTNKTVPGDVIVEAIPPSATDNTVSIFAINPNSANMQKINEEKALNGQTAGTYVGESCQYFDSSTNTAGVVSGIVYNLMKFHEDNN